MTPFSEAHSHYYGANIPGKPRRYLLNPGGRAKLHEFIDEIVGNDYHGFVNGDLLEPATAYSSGTKPTDERVTAPADTAGLAAS